MSKIDLIYLNRGINSVCNCLNHFIYAHLVYLAFFVIWLADFTPYIKTCQGFVSQNPQTETKILIRLAILWQARDDSSNPLRFISLNSCIPMDSDMDYCESKSRTSNPLRFFSVNSCLPMDSDKDYCESKSRTSIPLRFFSVNSCLPMNLYK